MKPPLSLLLFLLAVVPCLKTKAADAPPLHVFETITSDAIGAKLQSSFIWTDPSVDKRGVAVVFRKTLTLPAKPSSARLHLFADSRYILWVNGTYVERGPNRFQPNGPEYDTVNLAPYLQSGNNALAVLVVGRLSGGKLMYHVPGLTALLEVDDKEISRTDATWKWSNQTRYQQVGASWANLGDTLVDTRVEDGDWTQTGYIDDAWKSARSIDGQAWGALTARRIPLLAEKPVPFKLSKDAVLPVTLQAGESLEYQTSHLVQAYAVMELTADPDTEIAMEPFGMRYLARAGAQKHFTIDTRGFTKGAVTVKTGKATITGFKLIERLYPFERIGSFTSNDPFLNQLWELCARSCEVLSEDAYVDCADRERVEWMDCDPPGFDITRVAMTGPSLEGKPIYADPRLLGEMVRRTGLTLQADGWVKAHTCSDRYDIHAKMEDRACEWVTGLRRLSEASGDTSVVKEVWPAVVAQLDYFLQKRSERGLVFAREWVVWGNPTSYIWFEGAGLNAWVYKALVDAAWLGSAIGKTEDAKRFNEAATQLATAFNTVLWNETEGTFNSGYLDLTKDTQGSEKRLKLKVTDNLVAPTVYPAIFALERGIVSPEHRVRVIKYLLAHREVKGRMMIYYYLHKLLYGLDEPAYDTEILETYRKQWNGMVAAPAQVTWEEFGSGSHAHIYGMYPGYFLSTYVLGVRRDEPVPARKLIIEPHLGDLTEASGRVVTEFGPVDVAWKIQNGTLDYTVNIPPGITAVLRLPGREPFELNGKKLGVVSGNRVEAALSSGKNTGQAVLPKSAPMK